MCVQILTKNTHIIIDNVVTQNVEKYINIYQKVEAHKTLTEKLGNTHNINRKVGKHTTLTEKVEKHQY